MSVNPSPAAPAAPPTPAAGAPTPSSMSLPGKIPRTTYLLFAIVCVGTSLGSLTQTALNTMAAEVLADLGTDIGWGQWLTTAYIFSMGVAVPLASYLQRKFSVRTLLLGAFSLYLAGSLCDFLALNFPMLIVGRVLEAVATGILMPLVQTIAMTRFPENRHGTAMGIAGIALGFAPNIGPTVGGMLIGAVGWRFLFLVLSAASALLLVATFAIVRGREARQPAARLEVRSLVLAAAGFGGLLAGFTDAANYEPASPFVWVPAAVGAVCLVLFIQRQRRVAHPLMNLGIFAYRTYRVSFVTQLFLYGCFLGMTLIIPLFVIEAGGHTTLEAGLVLLPGALAALVFEPLAGVASDWFGPRRVGLFGATFLVAGAVPLALVPASAPLWIAALLQTLRCVGLTTLIPTTTAWGLGELRREGITTDGSASMIMSRQIAAALATAVMVLLIKQCSPAAAPELGYHLALGFSGLLALLVLATVALFIRERETKEDGEEAVAESRRFPESAKEKEPEALAQD
ncbi:MAG TPA: MFS transporter [Gordonibacter urolithinfaciens]|uniref:MFS transporter n=1 Tax=Gordonibacter urolithinfaciens TaxID=1335613 RepID=UPI001D376FF7|nr:MFS transporter [Gordonibacter urolithinfaciens]HJF63675.1 MFS transporter [Gordonibacter urolithinfaciens]